MRGLSRPADGRIAAIYVTHNGIGSALVRSQVLPYLRGLAARGHDVHLVTFERGDVHFPAGEFPADHWHSIPARPGSALLSKATDAAIGVVTLLRLCAHLRPRVLHARSYLPAAIVRVASMFARVPFIFDMRGFLGEEYVEGGHWRRRDIRFRLVRFAERDLLRRAAAIVVLTQEAAQRLRGDRRYRPIVRGSLVTVIPCTVDLDRFRPVETAAPPAIVYAGSLGLWYALDAMLRVYLAARALVPALRFVVLNRDQQPEAWRAAERLGVTDGLEVRGVDFAAMPPELARARVGICLLRQSGSKLASSPIKVAEYLACGLPVVVNQGQGDTASLVRRYAAGHVMEAYGDRDVADAGRAVATLLEDRTARASARRLAEREYDLNEGVRRYAELYQDVAAGGRRA